MVADILDGFITVEQRALMREDISRALTFPSCAFTSHEYFNLEVQRVFHKQWVAVSFEHAVPKAGDVLPIEILGQPLLILRDPENNIRVFHNVCPYDGCPVVLEAANLSELVVPYHGWRYNFDGKLVSAPYWNGLKDTDPGLLNDHKGDLVEIRCGCSLGVIFINQGGAAADLAETLTPIYRLLEEYDLENLSPKADTSSLLVNGRNVKANWKTYLENAAMNVLHESFTHDSYERSTEVPRVTKQGVKTYFDHIDGNLMGLGYQFEDFSQTYQPLPLPHLGVDHPPRSGYFLTFYPNLVIPVMSSVIRMNICLPLAPDSTQILHCSYYSKESTAKPHFERIAALVRDGFHKAYGEDGIVIEAIQSGRLSPVSGSHFYSPFWDAQHYHFNQLLLADLDVTSEKVDI